jgi:hypothetical protein
MRSLWRTLNVPGQRWPSRDFPPAPPPYLTVSVPFIPAASCPSTEQ